MREVKLTKNFERDIKRVKKRGCNMPKVYEVIELLANGISLPQKYRQHSLRGSWNKAYECHVEPDLLLVYNMDTKTLELLRLGSHSDLF